MILGRTSLPLTSLPQSPSQPVNARGDRRADHYVERKAGRDRRGSYRSGQGCAVPSRMLVPATRLGEVEDLATQAVESIVVGDPCDARTTMGPVASRIQYERVQSYIVRGIEEGATLLCGGPGRPSGLTRGYFVRPTVFSRVNNAMTIAREEIFGPVLAIIPQRSGSDRHRERHRLWLIVICVVFRSRTRATRRSAHPGRNGSHQRGWGRSRRPPGAVGISPARPGTASTDCGTSWRSRRSCAPHAPTARLAESVKRLGSSGPCMRPLR